MDHTVDIVHDENRIIREIDHEMSKADQMLRFVDEELTLQTRRVVNMHYRQKLTYREISEELGISEAAHHLGYWPTFFICIGITLPAAWILSKIAGWISKELAKFIK